MGKALPLDLRSRVIDAIEGGMSRRQAAERFDLSATCAAYWHTVYRLTGDAQPKLQGGDKRSGLIESHATVILALLDQKPSVTLAEIQAFLAERGVSAGIGTVWRFLDRRGIMRPGSVRRGPRSPS